MFSLSLGLAEPSLHVSLFYRVCLYDSLLSIFTVFFLSLAFVSLRSLENICSCPTLLHSAVAFKPLVLKCVCVSAWPVVVLPPPPPPLLFLRLMCLSLPGSDSAEASGRLFVTL